jgi:L-seryl-tRNA(Ser) seleniumtransferase
VPSDVELYQSLPSVDELLLQLGAEAVPRALARDEARAALAAMRAEIRDGRGLSGPGALERIRTRLKAWRAPSLRPVINATGVILHTNLGRAPLSASAVEAVARTAGRYCNLEYDLRAGRRGRRDTHAGLLLEKILGAPAIVVNNNAAAIFLALHELGAGGETVVSRGELIEIGDGFRVPEIMERSGTRLREIGATNKTRLEDYRAAIGPATKLLLRVHPSNFRIEGFTGRPGLAELAGLAREHGLPLVEDLGSGSLWDLSAYGVADEPPVTASLAAGVSLATFSGDKLLGGPQAGIIAGEAELVERVRRNPLFRAFRADKVIYAALEATLRDFLLERWEAIPALRMARLSADEIDARARRLAARLGGEVVDGESLLGGGSTPARTLPTRLVRLRPSGGSAAAWERRLRSSDPAVVTRIADDALLLDLRTVFPDEEETLTETLERTQERFVAPASGSAK